MKSFLFLVFFVFGLALCCAQENLPIYKSVKDSVDESTPVAVLTQTDWIKELPIPKIKVKKVTWVTEKTAPEPDNPKDKNGKKKKKNKKKPKPKKKKVITYVEEDPPEPPRFVPIECKFGKVMVKRSDLARFQQQSQDLSGEYASKTGSIFLKKSPTNPRLFNIVIQNGPFGNRAEFEMGNVEMRESNGHGRMTFNEDGCTVDMAVVGRRVKVVEKGCNEYHSDGYGLAGEYDTYKGNTRKAEVFSFPEQQFKFKKYGFCPSGFDSCEKVKDDNGAVFITWSKGGNGFIERKAGEDVHTYRPFEHVIPHKKDFFDGEKPIIIKTKRTDMAGEWMFWYFYPKHERFKMMRAGMREDIAYMEIYED
ncbi:MAG: hypothetical protein HUK21_09940 [Fibrobacteraceae bacterium]|nr:hypothetical protein [Fibrobacteraceae bacterium]